MAGKRGARRPRKHPAAPDSASKPRKAAPRGAPFPTGNKLGLPTQFKPGQTGNPGGVPKDVTEYRNLIRRRIPVMLARLDDVLHHGTEEGIIKAIREVNANAFPKPVQSIELGGPDGGPIPFKTVLTSDEKRKRAEALIADAVARAAAKKPG